MNVTLLHPLFIRNTPIMFQYYELPEETKYSEVFDMYKTEDSDHSRHTPFDFTKPNRLELDPSDCLYLPSHWWIQIVFEVEETQNDSKPKNMTLEWVEYHYSNNNLLEDVLFEGLMNGFGS